MAKAWIQTPLQALCWRCGFFRPTEVSPKAAHLQPGSIIPTPWFPSSPSATSLTSLMVSSGRSSPTICCKCSSCCPAAFSPSFWSRGAGLSCTASSFSSSCRSRAAPLTMTKLWLEEGWEKGRLAQKSHPFVDNGHKIKLPLGRLCPPLKIMAGTLFQGKGDLAQSNPSTSQWELFKSLCDYRETSELETVIDSSCVHRKTRQAWIA